MKMLRNLILALAFIAPCLWPNIAPAQVRVVATCGSLTPTQPAGSSGGFFTVDQNGQQCSSGAGALPTNAAQETGGNLAAILSAVQGSVPAGTHTIGIVAQPDAAVKEGTVPVEGTGSYTCSATCNTTNSGVLVSLDTSGYAQFDLQVTGTAAGDTFIVEKSDDNTTWYLAGMYTAQNASSTFSPIAVSTNTNTLNIYGVPLSSRYIRVRATAYSSGTMSGTWSLRRAQNQIVYPILLADQYPLGATKITGNSAGTTGAVVGTLAKTAGRSTYICGFDVSAIGGTASVGPITIAGLVGSSMVFQISSTAAGNTLSRTFTPCIPSSAANTDITITTTADGTATAVNVNSWGYLQ